MSPADITRKDVPMEDEPSTEALETNIPPCSTSSKEGGDGCGRREEEIGRKESPRNGQGPVMLDIIIHGKEFGCYCMCD